jgi:hypothetical protein
VTSGVAALGTFEEVASRMLRAQVSIGDLASAVAAGAMPNVYQVVVELLAEVNTAEARALEALALLEAERVAEGARAA